MKIFLGNRPLARGAEGGEEPFAVNLEVSGLVQIARSLRGRSATPMDRGNRRTELHFSVLRRHRSTTAATEFLLSHGAALLDLDTRATLICEGSVPATFTLEPAVLLRVEGSQDGSSTTHSYAVLGGSLMACGGDE